MEGFPHNPDNYLRDRLWTEDVVKDGVIIPKPKQSKFPTWDEALVDIESKLKNPSYEIINSDIKAVYRSCSGDYKAGRIDQTKDAFINAAKSEYQARSENR